MKLDPSIIALKILSISDLS